MKRQAVVIFLGLFLLLISAPLYAASSSAQRQPIQLGYTAPGPENNLISSVIYPDLPWKGVHQPVNGLMTAEESLMAGEIVLSDLNGDYVYDRIQRNGTGVEAIDGRTQKVLWVFGCLEPSIPQVQGQSIYISGTSTEGVRYLYALDGLKGTSRWKVGLGRRESVNSAWSPTVQDKLVFAQTEKGIVAVDLQGREFVHLNLERSLKSVILPQGAQVYYLDQGWEHTVGVYAVDLLSKERKWVYQLPTFEQPELLAYNGQVIGYNYAGKMFALDAVTGVLKWERQIGSPENPAIRVSTADGKIAVWSAQECVVVDSVTGKTIRTIKDDMTGVYAISNGVLYYQNQSNQLVARSFVDNKHLLTMQIDPQVVKFPSPMMVSERVVLFPQNFTYAVDLGTVIEEKVTSPGEIEIGLVVTAQAEVKLKPLPNATTLGTLPFGTVVKFLQQREIVKGEQTLTWWQIQTEDRKIQGWVPDSFVGRPNEMYYPERDGKDRATLFFLVAQKYYNNPPVQERLINYILAHFPDQRVIEVEYGMEEDFFKVNLKVASWEALASNTNSRLDPQKRLGYYQKILQHPYATKEDKARASLTMAQIYKSMKDYVNAAVHSLDVITNFQTTEADNPFGLYDIEAADFLLSLYFQEAPDMVALGKECTKILKVTTNPAVVLQATGGVAASLIYEGKFADAEKLILRTVEKYPNETRSYGDYGSPNYSYYPFAIAGEAIIRKYADYAKAIDFLQQMKFKTKTTVIQDYIEFVCAKLWDEGHGSRRTVLENYQRVLSAEWFSGAWELFTSRVMAHRVRDRVEEIERSMSEMAVINLSEFVVKDGLRGKATTVIYPSGNVSIKVEYREKELVTVDGKVGYWTKIILPEGKVGWVLDTIIDPARPKALFAPFKAGDPVWEMEGAGPGRTGAVTARPLAKPVIVKMIPQISSTWILTADVNGDQVLDLLGFNGGLVAIDGVSQKMLWRYPCSIASSPLLAGEYIYLLAAVKETESLVVLNKKTGKSVWTLVIGNVNANDYSGYPSPVLSNNMMYAYSRSGKVMAIDLQKRSVAWKFFLENPVNGALTLQENLLYFTTRDDITELSVVYALDTGKGTVVWKYFGGRRLTSEVVVKGNYLICVSADRVLYALDAKAGALIWKQELTMAGQYGSWFKPVVDDATVYCVIPNSSVGAFDLASGQQKWLVSLDMARQLLGPPVVVTGALYLQYFAGNSDRIVALAQGDGSVLWSLDYENTFSALEYSPIVAQDKVIFVGRDKLYILSDSK